MLLAHSSNLYAYIYIQGVLEAEEQSDLKQILQNNVEEGPSLKQAQKYTSFSIVHIPYALPKTLLTMEEQYMWLMTPILHGICSSGQKYSLTAATQSECFFQLTLVVNPKDNLAIITDTFYFNKNTANYLEADLFGGLLDRCTVNSYSKNLVISKDSQIALNRVQLLNLSEYAYVTRLSMLYVVHSLCLGESRRTKCLLYMLLQLIN